MNTNKGRTICLVSLLVTLTTTNILATEKTESHADRITRLQAMEDHCRRVGDLPSLVGESCFEWLSEYFEDEPIWNRTMLTIYEGSHEDIHPPVLNERPLQLRYSAADKSLDDLPRWRDVFDGHIAERLNVVLSVFDDTICNGLGTRGAINPVHASRCRARELFKYASYLDACMTGYDRSSFLHTTVGEHGLTLYGRARENMDPSLHVGEDEGNGWQLVEKYLHTIWITEKCSSTFSNIIGVLAERFDHITRESSLYELKRALQPMHDTVMAIAARSGDAWAIQSFYVNTLYSDHEYWKSLYELNPLLFHRWMASVGRLWLDKEDQALHVLVAYNGEKRISPELDLDQYLRNFRITEDDFDLTRGSVASLLEDMDWQYNLKYPWTAEDMDYE